MIDLKINQVKEAFFDRAKVASRIDRATRKVLSKFGAYVRTRSRTSIRKRKGVSEPGSPPSSHTGLLRSNIFFVYDGTKKSVVIGPILLNKPGQAPKLLEQGGEAEVKRGRKVRKLFYRARPFMMPAFRKELEQRIPGDFAGEVKE